MYPCRWVPHYSVRRGMGHIKFTHAKVFLRICCTSKDACSICQTCSIPSPFRLGSGMLANIFSFKGLECALVLAHILSAIFFAGKLLCTWSILGTALHRARRFWSTDKDSVFPIDYAQWSSNARFTSDMALDAAALVQNVFRNWQIWKVEKWRKN